MPIFGNMQPGQGMFGALSNVGGAINPYSNRLMMAGLGMLSGNTNQEGFQGAMQGLAAGSEMDQSAADRKKELKRLDALHKSLAAGDFGRLSPTQQDFLSQSPDVAGSLMAVRMKPAQGTGDMQEYQQALQQGFKGTLLDYQIKLKEAGRPQTTINNEQWKVPPGYMLKEPSNPDAGLTPIPGGPAEQIPSEVAARVGLAENFLSQKEAIKKKILSGTVTGVVDRARAGFDSSSDQAQTYRLIQSGTDALQRMLTGAGMPASEAQQYANRYLPTYTDDANSAAKKLDQLEMELKRIQSTVMRGRGGADNQGEGNGNLTPNGDGSYNWTPTQ